MAYIKYKELTKYFDFKSEVDINHLPEYTTEYVRADEKIILGYKTSRDHAIFTDKTMILFDRDIVGSYKKIHIIPYQSISTSAICFKPGKAEILLSLDSGYQSVRSFNRNFFQVLSVTPKEYREALTAKEN